MSGDCQLLNRIYFDPKFLDGEPPPIHYADKKKTRIEYLNEHMNWVVEPKSVFAEKMIKRLMHVYLRGHKHVSEDKHQAERIGMVEYDITLWHQHLHQYSGNNSTYNVKMINQVNIPFK